MEFQLNVVEVYQIQKETGAFLISGLSLWFRDSQCIVVAIHA